MLKSYRSPAALVGPLLVALALIPFVAGCPGTKVVRTTVREADSADALATVRDLLRREPQLSDCQTAVAQLNIYLARAEESRPAPLSASEQELLAKRLRLTEAELKEVGGAEFTPLDTHYLEESLLFQNAVRSLKLDAVGKGEPAALERARLTLAWSARQVWPLEQPGGRPLSPAAVLRFGFGSAAERLGVAMAALQQAGVEAGLVGHAKGERGLRVWAIGVAAGGDVHLFDPDSGRPVTGPDDKGGATLKQLRAAPERVKALVEAADPGADVKASVAAARVFLSPPLSALAPRMRWLQGLLTTVPPVVLGVDPSALADRFAAAGERPEFWNAPGDPNGLTRRLTGALPPSEGGSEPKEAADRNVARAQAVLVPVEQAPAPLRNNVITGEPRERMMRHFSGRFVELALEPGKPRDLLLRGRFDEATRALSEALARTAELQQRIGSTPGLEKDALDWAKDMLEAAGRLAALKDRPNSAPSEVAAAQSRVDALNKNSGSVALLIEQAVAEPYTAALTYQMALCMHEQAERRARGRGAAAARREAWQNAAGWWENYLARYAAAPWAKRPQIDHARRLLAEARRAIADLPR